MRSYFSQFGDVTRLRLSRNPKTGKSRHYAFVEFASSEVASIVARTMDKYLMFGHILQVKTIPKEQVHEKLFEGANKRFKPIPRAKLLARKLKQPKSKVEWDEMAEAEEARRKTKLEKLKEIGYGFEAPRIKTSGDLGSGPRTIEMSADEQHKLLTEEPHEEEEEAKDSKVTATGGRKAKTSKTAEGRVTRRSTTEQASKTSSGTTKAPKAKKAKAVE
jgi:nucleolar protein 15